MSEPRTNLKTLLWNAENLFLLSDIPLTESQTLLDEAQWQKLSTSIHPNKSLVKCRAIARIIKEENPDLILLCEVGGLESLVNFNKLFLNETYSPALVEGNSNRNIDLGFLIRKNSGFYFDVISNKNRPINYLYPHERLPAHETGPTALTKPSHKFSRDAAELHLFLRDRDRPFLIVLLTHLKSQLDRERIDPQGFERRQAELKALVDLYRELQIRHPSVPMAVCGDFNGSARKSKLDSEFKYLYETSDLVELTEWAGLKESDCSTFYQVGRTPNPEGRQIDYCFTSPQLLPHIDPKSVYTFRFKDHLGQILDPPTTIDAKMLLPSDHYPVVFEIKNLPML